MKALRVISWISTCVAVVIMVLACISLITGKTFFGFLHAVNYFQAADSFLLLAIALFIVTKCCACCNCESEEEKK
jgi:hypothetical protein